MRVADRKSKCNSGVARQPQSVGRSRYIWCHRDRVRPRGRVPRAVQRVLSDAAQPMILRHYLRRPCSGGINGEVFSPPIAVDRVVGDGVVRKYRRRSSPDWRARWPKRLELARMLESPALPCRKIGLDLFRRKRRVYLEFKRRLAAEGRAASKRCPKARPHRVDVADADCIPENDTSLS